MFTEIYDQYGHDADTNNVGGGGGGGGFPAGFRGFHGGGGEVNPEDLFNFLFTGGMGGMGGMNGMGGRGFRTHTFHFGGPGGMGGGRRGRERGEQQERGNGGGRENVSFFQQILQFLPIILMLLMSFNSISSNSNQPLYAFKPSPSYKTAMSTSSRGVSPDIKYYLSDSIAKQYAKASTESLRKLEKEIESEYKVYLSEKCRDEKAYQRNRLYQVTFISLYHPLMF